MMLFTGKKKNRTLRALAAAAFWILVWEAAALAVGEELILPTPQSVLRTLVSLCGTGDFWVSAAMSLARILSGYAAGVAAGTLLAVLTSRFSLADALISPVMRVVRATPVASFIILALLWLGKGKVPGFSASLMVVPIVWGAVTSAVRETDRGLLEMADSYRFGPWRTLKLIYVPSVYPSWLAACVTSMGLAWKAGVAAEVLCQPKTAIGSELYFSKIYLETPSLFAWTAVVILLSFLLEGLFRRLVRGREKP